MKLSSCILCGSRRVDHFFKDQTDTYGSDYYQCQNCTLIFAPPKDRPAPKDEFARYETHENDPSDEGYREFLGQLFQPMNKVLEPNSKGLDFGSGPGPTLNIMFEEQGHDVTIYDYFYADNNSVFKKSYDFITATEVLEHLFHPDEELTRLWNCLRPGGYFGIMTKLAVDDKATFANWHYRRDSTHVTFYTKETFQWLANHWNAHLEFHGNQVIILQKPK